MKEENYLFAWSLIPHVGYKRLKKIIDHFGDAKTAWENFKNIDPSFFGPKITGYIKEAMSKIDIEIELEKVYKKDVKIVALSSPDYPLLLKNIASPPIVLYLKGEFPRGNYISIVGTRRPSQYGITIAERLSGELVKRGGVIVSGMARGIDTHAHRAALQRGGTTIAVLGTGVDVVYPFENKRLYEDIVSHGAVISEYPMGTKPKREYFPQRNRIIAGLSLGTLVVEAPERSGALITANFATEEGREVFAVPGPLNSEKSKGTNKLIKSGAKLVENITDIIEEFPYVKWREDTEKEREVGLNDKEKIVYSLIGDKPKYIDEISVNSTLTREEIFSVILTLELKGYIKEIGGKRYCKIK